MHELQVMIFLRKSYRFISSYYFFFLCQDISAYYYFISLTINTILRWLIGALHHYIFKFLIIQKLVFTEVTSACNQSFTLMSSYISLSHLTLL